MHLNAPLPPVTSASPDVDDRTRTVRFLHRGQEVSTSFAPHRTVLDYLRLDCGLAGTKEGCAEGDCGACTVVLAEPDPQYPGRLVWRAVNSCVRLANSLDGCALFSVDDLGGPATPHPIQEALASHHASQCGFCTPGFVMSLYAQYQTRGGDQGQACSAMQRDEIADALSGNLCRCTGYRPIVDAALALPGLPAPAFDGAALASRLRALRTESATADADTLPIATREGCTWRPARLPALLKLRAAHPQALLVAGATDVGLWFTKQLQRPTMLIDLSGVTELHTLQRDSSGLHVGAAVVLEDAWRALAALWPGLERFWQRFASLPVRNSGTLGGNLANGSPIGDSMPLLIALGAHITLASKAGTRDIALEDFYLGYRQTALADDEVLMQIHVPAPRPTQQVFAYKISKRFDQDISAVCLGLMLDLREGRVHAARIGAGGVAATPVRARATEGALLGRPWTADAVAQAARILRDEFSPISDLRASSAYRRSVLCNLLQRALLQSQSVAVSVDGGWQ